MQSIYTVHMYTYTRIYRYTRVQTDRGESNRDETLSSFEMSKLMAVNKISIRLNDQTENSIVEDWTSWASLRPRGQLYLPRWVYFLKNLEICKSKRLYYLNSLKYLRVEPRFESWLFFTLQPAPNVISISSPSSECLFSHIYHHHHHHCHYHHYSCIRRSFALSDLGLIVDWESSEGATVRERV